MQELQVDDLTHIELSLTKSPANGEEFIMTKNADGTVIDPDPKPDEGGNGDGGDNGGGDAADKTPAYNLTAATPEAQQAAAILGEQLLSQQESLKLDGQVLEFAKSAAALKKTSDPITIAKSVLGSEVVDAITAPLKDEVIALQKSVQGLQDEKDLESMVAIAREIEPDSDREALVKTATRLLKLQKAFSTEEFKDHIEREKGTAVQLRKSALFERTGSNRGAVAGTAEQRIEQMKVELTKSATKDTDILGQIAKENPALWAEYQQEVRYRSANGVGR